MAKTEIKGLEFTKCEAFWDMKEGESFTGVLIDCNEKFPDKMKGPSAVKPLYIMKSLGTKGESPSLSLDEKPVKNKDGLIVGVFDTGELNQKIYQKYDTLLGKEITITFEKKEPFEKDGVMRTIKRCKVMAEDKVDPKYGSLAVARKLAAPTTNGKSESGESVPFET